MKKQWIVTLFCIQVVFLFIVVSGDSGLLPVSYKILDSILPLIAAWVLIINPIILFSAGISLLKKDIISAAGIIFYSLATLCFLVRFLGLYQEPRKSHDLIVKAYVSNMLAEAQTIYSKTGSYSSACDNPVLVTMIDTIKKNNAKKEPVLCFGDSDSWVATTKLRGGNHEKDAVNYFCSDSTGTRKVITAEQYNSIVNSDTLCQ